MIKEKLHIILLGPQGSGKGTQAKFLADKFNLEHLETGQACREIIKSKTKLGVQVAKTINQGKLVSFSLLIKIVKAKLKQISKTKGIIFDGTPRRLVEIDPLKNILSTYNRQISHIFFIQISEKETIKRLNKRGSCEKCGTPYILEKTITDQKRKCSKCQGKIVRRADETSAAIKQRLALYHQKTAPVVEYYRRKNKLIVIKGEQSTEKVFQDILSYL